MQTNSLYSYLRCLVHADVRIGKEVTGGISFNDSNLPENFSARLVMGECVAMLWLAGVLKRTKNDPDLKMALDTQFRRVRNLYSRDPEYGYLHRHLAIMQDGKMIDFHRLPPKWKEKIARYIELQYRSFEVLSRRYFSYSDGGEENIRVNIGATELVEFLLEMSIAGRIEGERGKVHMVVMIRYFARAFGVPFPTNYHTIVKEVLERVQPTKFLDELRRKLIDYKRKKQSF